MRIPYSRERMMQAWNCKGKPRIFDQIAFVIADQLRGEPPNRDDMKTGYVLEPWVEDHDENLVRQVFSWMERAYPGDVTLENALDALRNGVIDNR